MIRKRFGNRMALGLCALMACGLNPTFGVMRVINFAHGDILAIAALPTVAPNTIDA